MQTSLVNIGNSIGLIIPKSLLNKFGSVKKVKMKVKDDCLFVMPVSIDKPRKNWENLFAEAIREGYKPENDSFKGTQNEFDKTEWTW